LACSGPTKLLAITVHAELRGHELPKAVEAVAAYPGQNVWQREVQPELVQPPDLNAAEALITLSRPFLLPDTDENELDSLRRAIDLALDEDYVKMRSAYHDWFRDFIEPLRVGSETDLTEIRVDPGSLEEAEKRLRTLWTGEKPSLPSSIGTECGHASRLDVYL
jgi:hypothetical protein